MKFGVGQKCKSCTIDMLFTFCTNNKTLYAILTGFYYRNLVIKLTQSDIENACDAIRKNTKKNQYLI